MPISTNKPKRSWCRPTISTCQVAKQSSLRLLSSCCKSPAVIRLSICSCPVGGVGRCRETGLIQRQTRTVSKVHYVLPPVAVTAELQPLTRDHQISITILLCYTARVLFLRSFRQPLFSFAHQPHHRPHSPIRRCTMMTGTTIRNNRRQSTIYFICHWLGIAVIWTCQSLCMSLNTTATFCPTSL